VGSLNIVIPREYTRGYRKAKKVEFSEVSLRIVFESGSF
jgi:hypothetical protein